MDCGESEVSLVEGRQTAARKYPTFHTERNAKGGCNYRYWMKIFFVILLSFCGSIYRSFEPLRGILLQMPDFLDKERLSSHDKEIVLANSFTVSLGSGLIFAVLLCSISAILKAPKLLSLACVSFAGFGLFCITNATTTLRLFLGMFLLSLTASSINMALPLCILFKDEASKIFTLLCAADYLSAFPLFVFRLFRDLFQWDPQTSFSYYLLTIYPFLFVMCAIFVPFSTERFFVLRSRYRDENNVTSAFENNGKRESIKADNDPLFWEAGLGVKICSVHFWAIACWWVSMTCAILGPRFVASSIFEELHADVHFQITSFGSFFTTEGLIYMASFWSSLVGFLTIITMYHLWIHPYGHVTSSKAIAIVVNVLVLLTPLFAISGSTLGICISIFLINICEAAVSATLFLIIGSVYGRQHLHVLLGTQVVLHSLVSLIFPLFQLLASKINSPIILLFVILFFSFVGFVPLVCMYCTPCREWSDGPIFPLGIGNPLCSEPNALDVVFIRGDNSQKLRNDYP